MHIPCPTAYNESQVVRRAAIAKSVAESPTARKRALSAGASPLDRHSAVSEIRGRGLSAAGFAYHGLQPSVERIALSAGGFYAIYKNFILGEPVCAQETLPKALSEITARLDRPTFAHISEECALELKRRGFNIISLGNESVIDLPFSLDGSAKADLRRARNNAKDGGIRVIEVDSTDFEQFTTTLREHNDAWLSKRSFFRREFRFLARPFVDEFMPGERRFLAFFGSRIVGMAVYDPSFTNGAITGYFESIVRSFAESLKGVRDSLTLKAISAFQAEGAQTLSLGLCPFETPQLSSPISAAPVSQSALRCIYRYGERIFPFKGLGFHKSRYRGRGVPIFFATKSIFPLFELYRLCRVSRIDPLGAFLD